MTAPVAAARRASALPAVFALTILIGGLLLVSSDRVLAVKKQQDLGLAKQQAAYAAEAVAAMKEVEMVNMAGANDLTALDTRPNPNAGVCFFGNSAVRWRIEPVKVTNPNASWTANPLSDVNVPDPADVNYQKNYDYYVYRISTEAYTLRDPERSTALPFNLATGEAAPPGTTYDPLNRVAAMQAQRVIQLKLNSLFKYAIFYACDHDDIGDLEFWVGTGITVRGAIHSNGAIYIGGQANAYSWGDYHNAASYGGSVTLGGAYPNQISICGVNGIYRMRKGCNVLAGFPNPRTVSTASSGAANDLNGDTPSSTLHSLNGIAFTSANDSRSAAWSTPANPFAPYVRDSTNGGTIVRTLANIPQLAGRPFEHQRLAPEGGPLYWRSALDHSFTVRPQVDAAGNLLLDASNQPISRRLYYASTAGAGPWPLTDVPTPDAVPSTNLPLYDFGGGVIDVWPDTTTPPVVASGLNEGFAQQEARGYYLNLALNGDNGGSTTGLVIRERPVHVNAHATPLWPYKPDWWWGWSTSYAAWYAAYMKDSYQVMLHGQDVTEDFFNQIATVTDPNDCICSEDSFYNAREATAMNVWYGKDRGTCVYGGYPYWISALTLNLRKVQDWLKTATVGGTTAKSLFNGLIYAHRTRRTLTYHPILRPTLVFDRHRSTVSGGPNTSYSFPSDPGYGMYYWLDVIHEGDGPIETFHSAIRIKNGANIDWAHGAGPAPLGTSGLTIVTPNMCYMQGDFNTVQHPDPSGTNQTTPCAVFADGVTALSNAWDDNAHRWVGGLTNGSATTYNVSYVINNVPTDDISANDEGSGAVANVVRFLENWGGLNYNFKGSLVVMNRMRYSYTTLGASAGPYNMWTNYYSPPTRNITFNTDLLSRAGQPPYTPFGVQVIRTVSTVLDVTQ